MNYYMTEEDNGFAVWNGNTGECVADFGPRERSEAVFMVKTLNQPT